MTVAVFPEMEVRKGVTPESLNRALKGVGKAPARAFYRYLEWHFFEKKCVGCTSYENYGVMLVRGQFYEHMKAFANPPEDVFELISCLKESGLISVQKNDGVYRVTFHELCPEA